MFPDLLYYAIPNGDYRSFRAGMRLKNEGVRAGMMDLCVAEPSSHYHGLYVELKQPGNVPNDKQTALLLSLLGRGYYACWCDTLEDASDVLRRYMHDERID